MRYGGIHRYHHTALVISVYPPGTLHPQWQNTKDFPGPDAAEQQMNVTRYFMGTKDDDGRTAYRSPDIWWHFDYLNSRSDAKRNAELIYYANDAQVPWLPIPFVFGHGAGKLGRLEWAWRSAAPSMGPVGSLMEGRKRVLGIQEGATENGAACKDLLQKLVERGLDPERQRLFVIDGSKALRSAINAVFGDKSDRTTIPFP